MGPSRIAIIAGSGRFPFHVAEAARRRGVSVVAVGLKGWVDASLAGQVDAYEELAVGELGQLIRALKRHAVSQAIMAGKVTKAVLLDQGTAFDPETLAILGRVKDFSVASLLGAVGERLAQEGITLLDSSTFLRDQLCPPGVLTARAPSPVEAEDIRVGLQVGRQLAALDVGQTVILKRRVVVAVEALEGTDAAIQRAHALSGDGLVVVKTAAEAHDRRFDLPVIGPQTIATLAACGVSCLAMEAGTTLLLDREKLLGAANAAGVCLVGMEAGG